MGEIPGPRQDGIAEQAGSEQIVAYHAPEVGSPEDWEPLPKVEGPNTSPIDFVKAGYAPRLRTMDMPRGPREVVVLRMVHPELRKGKGQEYVEETWNINDVTKDEWDWED